MVRGPGRLRSLPGAQKRLPQRWLPQPAKGQPDFNCGQSCGQDVKELCRIEEIMHKILGRHGNFVLSHGRIRASIFLHAKAPNGGNAALPEGFGPSESGTKTLDLRVCGLWIAAVPGGFGLCGSEEAGLRV